MPFQVRARQSTAGLAVYQTAPTRPPRCQTRALESTEPGKTGFTEQEVPLGAVKAGWIVSATTKHEGNREVAEQVKIVVER